MLNSTSHIVDYVDQWPFIPSEAFLYFPAQSEIHSGAGKTYARKIFDGNLPFEEFEERKIEELDATLAKLHKTLMPWFTKSNKLRFIQACKFDIDKTVKSVLENNQWRLKTFPIQKNSFADSFIQSGAIYICGRDHCYRPIIVMDLSRFDTNNSQIQKAEFLSKVLAVFFEFMISHMFIEGQVENYVMIINLNSLMMFAIGGIAKRLLEFTNNMYRGRLFMAYIVNTSSGISFFWKPVQSFLSQNTLKKIILTDKPFSQQLFKHTNPSQIEQKYGGTLPNITANFFPPTIHSYDFLLNTQKAQSKLVSEQQYLNYYRAGKLQDRKVSKKLVGGAQEAGGNSEIRTSFARESETVRPFSPIIMHKPSIQRQVIAPQNARQSITYENRQSANFGNQPPPNARNSQISASSFQRKEPSSNFKMQLNPVQVAQQEPLRRKDSLQQQMDMDLQFIGANALGGTNSIVNIPVGQYPLHRALSVTPFFQQSQYISMKRANNPSFRS